MCDFCLVWNFPDFSLTVGHIHSFLWYVTAHPYPKFIGGLHKSTLKLGWIIICQRNSGCNYLSMPQFQFYFNHYVVKKQQVIDSWNLTSNVAQTWGSRLRVKWPNVSIPRYTTCRHVKFIGREALIAGLWHLEVHSRDLVVCRKQNNMLVCGPKFSFDGWIAFIFAFSSTHLPFDVIEYRSKLHPPYHESVNMTALSTQHFSEIYVNYLYNNIKRTISQLTSSFHDRIQLHVCACSQPSTHTYAYIFPWWRHQMETCSALLALCAGNSPATGEFPSQRPVTRIFFICVWINGWVNNREVDDLRRHRDQYDVIVIRCDRRTHNIWVFDIHHRQQLVGLCVNMTR